MKYTMVTCEVNVFHFSNHQKGSGEDKRNKMEKGRKLGEWKKIRKKNGIAVLYHFHNCILQ
jgi:hypothetical protein